MAIYEIKQWSGGLADEEDKGIAGAYKFAKNNDPRKRNDSFSAAQAFIDIGVNQTGRSPSASVSPSASPSRSPSLSVSASSSPTPSPSASTSPSPSPSATGSATPSSSVSPSPSSSAGITTQFLDLIRWWVEGSDGYTYGFGNTGYVYRIDEDFFVQRVYKDPDGAIKGAAEWYATAGKTFLQWANDKKLKRKPMPGLANYNDVETQAQNLNSADYHTMREAGGSLIIANGPVLALVGYDQSYTNEALNLIPGNISKTLVERDGRTIVGTYRPGNPAKGINGAIDAEVPLAQIGDDGELFYADMQSSTPITRFPGGGKVNPGGVCNQVDQVNFFEWEQNALNFIDKQSVGNMALFAVYDADEGKGGVYSYGRKRKNKPMILNCDYQFDADELGAIISVNGVTMVSYRDGSDFGVKVLDENNKAEAVYEGLDFRAPVKTPVETTIFSKAELYMKPLPAGSWVEFWYKLDKTGDFIRARVADKVGGVEVSQWNLPLTKKAVFRIQAAGEIFEPKIVVHPYGNETPEIHRARIYFK